MVAFLGGCGFVGRPQIATWPDATPCPSIWRLQAVQELANLRCECVCVASIDQCCFGASALKPTTLLLVCRFEHFRKDALTRGRGGQCVHDTEGDRQGSFRTRAQVYPEGLNRALADAFFAFVSKYRLQGTALPQELSAFCAKCHAGG